ncbi:MAG: hypothetical protein WCP86_00600 [bacterium]
MRTTWSGSQMVTRTCLLVAVCSFAGRAQAAPNYAHVDPTEIVKIEVKRVSQPATPNSATPNVIKAAAGEEVKFEVHAYNKLGEEIALSSTGMNANNAFAAPVIGPSDKVMQLQGLPNSSGGLDYFYHEEGKVYAKCQVLDDIGTATLTVALKSNSKIAGKASIDFGKRAVLGNNRAKSTPQQKTGRIQKVKDYAKEHPYVTVGGAAAVVIGAVVAGGGGGAGSDSSSLPQTGGKYIVYSGTQSGTATVSVPVPKLGTITRSAPLDGPFTTAPGPDGSLVIPVGAGLNLSQSGSSFTVTATAPGTSVVIYYKGNITATTLSGTITGGGQAGPATVVYNGSFTATKSGESSTVPTVTIPIPASP